MVTHNDNSDRGQAREMFPDKASAHAYVEARLAEGPQGNESHPAPETLDLRVFRIESFIIRAAEEETDER